MQFSFQPKLKWTLVKYTKFLLLSPTALGILSLIKNCSNFVVAQNNDDGKWWTFLLQLSRCFWGDLNRDRVNGRGRAMLIAFCRKLSPSFISKVYGSKHNEKCNPFLFIISLFNKTFSSWDVFLLLYSDSQVFIFVFEKVSLVQPNLAKQFNWKEFL